MLLQHFTSFPNTISICPFRPYRNRHLRPSKFATSWASINCQLLIRIEDIAQISHNKVIIAAGISAAVGQLSKPFTSVFLYRRDFDFSTILQSGGFPSSHSSAVVSAATCLGLERGFSDSIFGLAFIYASLVMYDSQGVRREVGYHAKTLNRILTNRQDHGSPNCQAGIPSTSPKSETVRPSFSEESSLSVSKLTNTCSLYTPDNTMKPDGQTIISSDLSANTEDRSEGVADSYSFILKESVGHSEVEVLAGALLGFLVSLLVYTIM